MNFEDYKAETLDNAKEFFDENFEDYVNFEAIFEAAGFSDSVTGNGSGSFTFSTYKAKQNVADLIWDAPFREVMLEYGYETAAEMFDDPESADVRARCMALDYVYGELEEYYDQLREEREED